VGSWVLGRRKINCGGPGVFINFNLKSGNGGQNIVRHASRMTWAAHTEGQLRGEDRLLSQKDSKGGSRCDRNPPVFLLKKNLEGAVIREGI